MEHVRQFRRRSKHDEEAHDSCPIPADRENTGICAAVNTPVRRLQALLRRRVSSALFVLGFALFAGVCAQPIDKPPAAVKAAFLYKFLTYVELPPATFAQPDSPIVIAVAGADDVYRELQQVVRERSVGGRPVIAKRLVEGDLPAGVHLLFIGNRSDPKRSALVQAARDRPLLLVTDSPNGLAAGSAINFVMVRDRVRFEVSLPAAEQATVKISSRILGVAERVVEVHR